MKMKKMKGNPENTIRALIGALIGDCVRSDSPLAYVEK